MSSSGSESPNLFPMLDDRPLPDLESDAGNGDDELTILDQQVRGHREPERRATESVKRFLRLSDLEIHSGEAEENCRSDEAAPFPTSERSIDPVVPPVEHSRRNNCTPRVAHRSGSQRRARAKCPKQVPHQPSALKQRKSGPNLPKEKVKIMRDWVKHHMDYPYPSPKEKEELARQVKLGKSQVSDWFAREIKRHLKPPADSSTPSNGSFQYMALSKSETSNQGLMVPDFRAISRELSSVGIAESPLLSQHEPYLSRRSTTPLDRYLSAPAQEEGSPAQTCYSLQSNENQPLFISRHENNPLGGPDALHAAQVSNVTNHNDSPHSNQQSNPSIQGTDASGHSTRQRGRRLIPAQFAPERQGDYRYQCTHCNRGHKYRSDCVRHEETHTPQQDCVCMLDGARLMKQGHEVCAFCGNPNPTEDHLSSHNIQECSVKHKKDRTFTRPSGLRVHMRNKHDATVLQPPDSWIVPIYSNPSRHHWCGYCGKYCRMTWEERGIHMAEHNLTDDYDMTRWIPLDDPWSEATALDPEFDFSFDI